MGRTARVVRATPGHSLELSACLREADRVELRLSSRQAPFDVLLAGVRSSVVSWAGYYDTRLVALFGVGAHPHADGAVGVPWLLGAEGLASRPTTLARLSRDYLDVMRGLGFSRLENYAWAGHAVALRWLEWLGFTVEPPAPFGPFGAPFCRFWMNGGHHV